MSYDELIDAVITWGREKGIVEDTKYQVLRQLDKHQEELNEVREAVENYYADPSDENLLKMANEFGDLHVTTIIPTACADIPCKFVLQRAYDKISKRTGKVVDGQFVKDN